MFENVSAEEDILIQGEVVRDGLKLHKEELHLQNFSPNIIQVNKSKGKSWALLVASMVEEKCSYTG